MACLTPKILNPWYNTKEGRPGRPVGKNIIQGSKEQVSEILQRDPTLAARKVADEG
jgi:hypothetical protein